MRKKLTVLVIICVCLISFFLISYQSKGLIKFPKIDLSFFLLPVNYAKEFFALFYLKEENKKLKEQLYQLFLQQKSTHELIEENKKLKTLLDLKETKKEIITIAKITHRGTNKLKKTFWIDKGSNNGIKIDMPAVTLNGVIGKVIFTSSNSSEVLLLTDPNFSVSVRAQRSRIEGILSGSGTNLCILKYIPFEEDIMVEDILITSGIDGIFPEGVKVGVVKKIEKKNGFFQHIEVTPYQSELKIEEVAIIKSSP